MNYLKPFQIDLSSFDLIKVSGVDAHSFLNGQTTADIKGLMAFHSTYNCRLNHVGKIQSVFYSLKVSEHLFYLLISSELTQLLIDDLNKFIIMDDVELSLVKDLNLTFSFLNNIKLDENNFQINFCGFLGVLSLNNHSKQIQKIDESILEKHASYYSLPYKNFNLFINKLINETRLNECAISYKKGCFLGQETVAKIENNRGAAYYPTLLKGDFKNQSINIKQDIYLNSEKVGVIDWVEEDLMIANLNRQTRVVGKKSIYSVLDRTFDAEIIKSPELLLEANQAAMYYYDLAVKIFNLGNIDLALESVDVSLFFSKTADALEVKAVMLGRKDKYEEALGVLDQLIEVDPRSVLAHTNKSLFLMKLGKITEAEDEKSLATIKSFEKFGEEAKVKKQLEEEKRKKEEELLRREKMFLQVLEIDGEDSTANFGLGEISHSRGKFIDAINFLEMAIKSNPNYSQAYLVLGKSYEAIFDIERAKKIFTKGVEVASKRGEMMPANEMQSRLNKI